MKVVLALGNPGAQYATTRHNTGFLALDAYAAGKGATFSSKPKFQADIASLVVNGEKILLVKPTTFYNEVGRTARAIADFYQLAPSDFLLVHDDLNLPLGTVRTRIGGSDGGSNGLKSIAAHLGTDTARLRIGVWAEHHQHADKVGVVLGNLSASDREVLAKLQPAITSYIDAFIDGSFAATTHKN